jgi:hypothetical protein
MPRFKTIATFSYPAEAVVVKAKLESEDVSVFLKDEYSVAADPFATNALGGVKMQVYADDYFKAMGILASSNPDLIKHRVEYIQCPNCKRYKTREITDVNSASGWNEKIKAGIYSILPFLIKHNYQCTHCKTTFNLDE